MVMEIHFITLGFVVQPSALYGNGSAGFMAAQRHVGKVIFYRALA